MIIQVQVNLDKSKPRQTGHWKFKMSLFEVEHFHGQFLLTLMQELMGSVDRNKLWGHLKSVTRSFTSDYSSWLNLKKLATQTATKSILECAIKWGDSADIAIAGA